LIIEKINHPGVENITAIPKSGEKFMSLSINGFYTFCDSMSFLTGSLDSLVKSLPKNHDFKILKQSKLNQSLKNKKLFQLLLEKWKYPYEYAESISELESCNKLPDINCFYNSLTGETVSIEDYNKSCQIFESLDFRNLREYMEAYCLIDVFLLAEVFTQFRIQTLENFGIDPCNYISLPGLGLDCFLKKSEVILDGVYTGKNVFNI